MLAAAAVMLPCGAVNAATFSGNASLKVDTDTTQSLTSTNGIFTVSCWFRLSIPSGVNLTENMTILMDRTDGDESKNFSYLLRFTTGGNVEFVTRGSGSPDPFIKTLIQRPFLERWYHVAIARSGTSFDCYVDGVPVQGTPESGSTSVGTTTGSGLAIGGISGTSKRFYGDIIEAAFYQTRLFAPDIRGRMFKDQRTNDNIKAYFKLAASTNATDRLKNFAPSPATGTEAVLELPSKDLIAFEETDQAGEQSLFDSRKNRGQDAIAALSGVHVWSRTVFARPTPGIALDWRIGYSSGNPASGGVGDPYSKRTLGPGWRHTFDTRLVRGESSTVLRLLTWEGSTEVWDRSPTNSYVYFTRHKEYRGELSRRTDGSDDFEWTTPERLVYRFRNPDSGDENVDGRLLELRDFNGNTVSLQWNEAEGRITQVTDSAGGSYQLAYSLSGLLTNLSFRQWSVQFAYYTTGPTNNFLASKTIINTSPAASGIITNLSITWQFMYGANGLLERVMDPQGNTNVFVRYDQYGRKTNQMDALGRLTKTEYNIPAKRQMQHTDPDSKQWIETYDRKGHILIQEDPLHQKTSYTYDGFGNRTSITEPLGYTTFFGYDSRANVIAQTNALGEVTRWVYHTNSLAGLPHFNKPVMQITLQPPDVNGFTTWTNSYVIEDTTGNLLRHHDSLGTLVTYTYRTNGLVETSTDANGRLTRLAYDTNGFLLARTDAATNTTAYAVNEVGWKLAETNALRQVTTFAYDLNGNVVRTVDPLQRTSTKTYDANGNLLTASDAKNQFTTYAYDAANQKTNMVDRTGTNTWAYVYTQRGELERATDPLGNTVTNFYDDANRLFRVDAPLNNSVTNVYDANGNVTERIDQLGRRWKKTYDRLNRVIAETDPLGNTRRTKYDVAGRIQEITTPNGYPSLHQYDGRGRLTKWTDAEGFQWLYTYDGVGNIVDIEDALHGHYVMTYGPRNERTLERNQDGKEWLYAYDELLRLKTQRDPNGITRTLVYDRGGRLESVTFSTGRVNAFAYDDNNNPTVLSRTGSGPPTISQLSYDVLDRVREYTDAFSKQVRYDYDRLGRITALTYPGGKTLTQGFDALSRLTTQVFQFAAQTTFTNTYAYDKAGRLVSRRYPNGIIQTNVFDTAGRLTDLTYATNLTNVTNSLLALTYAYDRNGNKTSSTEKGTLNWPMPSLTDEHADYTPSGRLKTRTVERLPSPGGEGQGEGGTNSQSVATITYAHDPSGNMTNATGNGQSWSLTYDEDNRVTTLTWDCNLTAKSITNRYDAFGRRIARTSDTTESRYVLDLAGSMERILCDMDGAGAITAWYVHGPDLSFKVDAAGKLTCYHADAMANIISLTDSGATNIAQYAYTPYGRSLSSTNCQSRLEALAANPYLFVGSQGVMEELPGLYFMRARYYSADAGVFLSTDPVKNIGPGWKPTAYGYANANPLRFCDATGQEYDSNTTYAGPGSGSFFTFIITKLHEYLFGVEVNHAAYVHDENTRDVVQDQSLEEADSAGGVFARQIIEDNPDHPIAGPAVAAIYSKIGTRGPYGARSQVKHAISKKETLGAGVTPGNSGNYPKVEAYATGLNQTTETRSQSPSTGNGSTTFTLGQQTREIVSKVPKKETITYSPPAPPKKKESFVSKSWNWVKSVFKGTSKK